MRDEQPGRAALRDLLKGVLAVPIVVPFGDGRYSGFHDGAQGVQWHIAHEAETAATYLAVNLEGLKYGRGRPIQRVVRLEAKKPRLVGVFHALARPEDIVVHVVREGWPSQRNRVYLDDRFILKSVAAQVSEEAWSRAMQEAAACLTDEGDRATQLVRRAGTTMSRMMHVLPHLTVGVMMWTGAIPGDAWTRIVRGRRVLAPVYDAMNARVQDGQT